MKDIVTMSARLGRTAAMNRIVTMGPRLGRTAAVKDLATMSTRLGRTAAMKRIVTTQALIRTATKRIATMTARLVRRPALQRIVMIALALLLLARPASAHPLELGYMRIETAGTRVSVELELDVNAAALALGTTPGELDAHAVQARASALAAASYGREAITTPAGACRFTTDAAKLVGRTVHITGAAECPASAALHWRFPLVADAVISPRFQLMVKQTVHGSERLTLVDKAQPELDIEAGAGSSVGFGHFVQTGVEHIGAAPSEWKTSGGGLKLPDGIDHILFLLALLLAGGRLRRLVGIASGFTLGHSITLALAALDVVRPPASIIEPLIALSIALAALEAYSGRLERHRWKIATGFGFIHGFGFAAALSHLELSTRGKLGALFGFNIGVEIGQLVIILLAAPLLMLLHRHQRVGRPIVRLAAAIIFACGMYWFFMRLH